MNGFRNGLLLAAAAFTVLAAAGARTFFRDRAPETSASPRSDASSRAVPLRVPEAEAPDPEALAADAAAARGTIRFLEQRVGRDPRDFLSLNKLAGYYLQALRETGRPELIDLARRTAEASLAAVRADRNPGGLAALAQVELASHDFVAARDHARQLMDLDPGKVYPYLIFADALLELGDYEGAAAVLRHADENHDGAPAHVVAIQVRLGRLAVLHGRTEAAERHLLEALLAALGSPAISRETAAFCRWQLGEIAFSVGDYEAAERHQRDALTTFPGYFRAHLSLARVRAARGDRALAIEHGRQALRVRPDPVGRGFLGDLYRLSGRHLEAAAQHALARIDPHPRQLALFLADHDLDAEAAYRLARREYGVRRDIYGADALAWTALKAGRLSEAREAVAKALRLGTLDARILYHAGMIARAAGDRTAARDHLARALALNPQFDPIQAPIARIALAGIDD